MNVKRLSIGLMVLIFTLLLSGCGAGAYAITNATLRDTIFSVEPRQNGTVSIWMTHDDVGVYCTRDHAIAELATRTLAYPAPYNEVLVTYRSVNNNDPEWQWFSVGDGCAHDKNTTLYLITGLTVVQEMAQSKTFPTIAWWRSAFPRVTQALLRVTSTSIKGEGFTCWVGSPSSGSTLSRNYTVLVRRW